MILICVAMGLTIAKTILATTGRSLSEPWETLFWLGSVVLIIHGFEGIAAAAIAHRKGNSVIKTWIYTFFTGTVGLWETIKSLSVYK